MKPLMISSTELPNLDFVESLADTLIEYGVAPEQVLELAPGVINFIDYLLTDSGELEEGVIRLRLECNRQERDLKHIRAQRNGLLSTLEELEGRAGTRATERVVGA
jgi:hypothetical protein